MSDMNSTEHEPHLGTLRWRLIRKSKYLTSLLNPLCWTHWMPLCLPTFRDPRGCEDSAHMHNPIYLLSFHLMTRKFKLLGPKSSEQQLRKQRTWFWTYDSTRWFISRPAPISGRCHSLTISLVLKGLTWWWINNRKKEASTEFSNQIPYNRTNPASLRMDSEVGRDPSRSQQDDRPRKIDKK